MTERTYKVLIERYALNKKHAGMYLYGVADDCLRNLKKFGFAYTLGYLVATLRKEGSRLMIEAHEEEKAAVCPDFIEREEDES